MAARPRRILVSYDGSSASRRALDVVAEALTNVLKYSQATAATIRVLTRDERLVVEVSDDGRGGARPSDGSGLGGLRDRVEALDGSFDVDSPPGRGTRVRAELPLAIGP